MDREDIIKLAQEAGLIRAGEHYTEPARWGITEITDFYQRAVAAERQRIITKNALEIERINAYIKELEEALVIGREKVAAWMMRQGYATGHGDTVEDLLKEVEWQIREREREACARVCEEDVRDEYIRQDRPAQDEAFLFAAITDCAAAIRARGEQ